MKRMGASPAARGSMGGQTCPDVIELSRKGSSPSARGSMSGETCPDVVEREGGDFLVIGKVVTLLPGTEQRLSEIGASVGTDETVVLVPRDVMLAAARQIVSELGNRTVNLADDNPDLRER